MVLIVLILVYLHIYQSLRHNVAKYFNKLLLLILETNAGFSDFRVTLITVE
jgi:hypothetical protein